MVTEKQYATAIEEPTAAQRQLTARFKDTAQDFAKPNVFRIENVCRGRLNPFT